MNRAGLLIIGAVIVAAAALGVIFFTDLLPGTFQSSPTQKLVSRMNEIASQGGFAASFSEADARKWLLADGHRFERLSVDSAQAVVGRLSSGVPVDNTPPSWESQGLSVELPVTFAQQWNGKRIEIGIIARTPKANPSDVLNVVYATRQAGNSGWRRFKLAPDFQIYTILFDLPEVATGYQNKPIIVLHSDAAGKGHSVELLGVYARQVPRTTP